MPEEMESPTERLEEYLHEEAEHAKENWLRWCAVLSAVFAVSAALSGLLASSYANKAMLEQIQASDQWGYYQAKGIKALIVETQNTILKQLPPQAGAAKPDGDRLEKYKQEEEAIHAGAEQLTKSSELHMEKHEITARAVTCFQVAIAMIAIVVLTKRRRFLLFSVALGMAGFFFLAWGVL
jgi:malonyl CoA-acyl carrier protein transacylase